MTKKARFYPQHKLYLVVILNFGRPKGDGNVQIEMAESGRCTKEKIILSRLGIELIFLCHPSGNLVSNAGQLFLYFSQLSI